MSASLLPVFFKLEGRRVLIVGAGRVALQKVEVLEGTGARLVVVAPEAVAEIRQRAAAGLLEWRREAYASGHLDRHPDEARAALVIAATSDAGVNHAVHADATLRGLPVNAVDDPAFCDFYFGASVRRGALQVAVSTAGESPAAAQRLRDEIEAALPQETGAWLARAGVLRRGILATHAAGAERNALLKMLAQHDLLSPEGARAPHPGAERVGLSADPGTVYLVGAGPGDPELLTLRAARLLAQAGAVLHDDLVPAAILALASPSALLLSVGKRCGAARVTQQQIHDLMIASARAGLSVVRLKSGDPLVFGRAQEEIEALEAAQIPYEIVPGITAAFAAAAAARCSLTDRRGAASVTLEAGQHAQERSTGKTAQKSDHPARSATRAVYMPGRDLAPLAAQWLAAGESPALPCVVVSGASRPTEQVQQATLATLAAVRPAESPAIVLAGWTLAPRQRPERATAAPFSGNAEDSRPESRMWGASRRSADRSAIASGR